MRLPPSKVHFKEAFVLMGLVLCDTVDDPY